MTNASAHGAEAPTAGRLGIREIDLTLIRPTNYTDDGYPIRTKFGVIRSNTLTQMGTLARDLVRYPFFSDVEVRVRLIDEAIQTVPVGAICRRARRPGVKSIVLCVGVQTNQYPRARDIAAWFLPKKIPVLIGGFHVSGMMAMVGLTFDLREAMMQGITLVAGEAEGDRLPRIIEDILRGNGEPLYNLLTPQSDLSDLPIPRMSKQDLRHFASPFSTIDTGRGCVFTCDFCTIINVQGRTMRFRDPRQVIEFVRRGFRDVGISHCFFTDDNLARNPRWREIFAGLARLREEEKIPFTFMMQSDLAARKIPPGDFFIQASRAGCRQVFFGVESVNRDNLRSQEKYQNQVAEYSDLVAHCQSLGIATHAGYILGLPFDTRAGIREDIGELQRIGFDSASFYILTPLPGSADHRKWRNEGRWMDPDFNTYDSAHVAIEPAGMTRQDLFEAWKDAWEQFYSPENMIRVLRRWRDGRRSYWERLFFFAWYLYASRIEGLHPMNCGFWTRRNRHDRRPGFARESLLSFWIGRVRSSAARIRGIVRLFFQFEEVWLRSRPKSRTEEALHEMMMRTRQGIIDSRTRVHDWRDLKARELVMLYEKLHREMPEIRVPSAAALWLRKKNPLAGSFSRSYIQRVWRQWYYHVWNPLKWIEVWMFECVTGVRFLAHLILVGRL